MPKIFFALREQTAKSFFAPRAESATSGLESVSNQLACSLSFFSVLAKQLVVEKTVCLGSMLGCHFFPKQTLALEGFLIGSIGFGRSFPALPVPAV